MRKRWKNAIKAVIFVALLVVVLFAVNRALSAKHGDGIYGLTTFYEQEENSIDVLVLGSSHAFEDINTYELWNEYGISSFDLCGSAQPMWNTYYYLKEALKTQNPKVIVLEAFMTTFGDEYSDDSRIIKNTYGMKWSMDKINAIKVSAPEDRWSEFLFPYVQYHSRYSELSSEDFLENKGKVLYENWKGFGCNMETMEAEAVDVSGVSEVGQMTEKTEVYYRKVIELAEEAGIPLLIVVTPYSGITEEHQRIYNQAEQIAAEYGVPFINYNLQYEEIGLDFSSDFADASHLNYLGNKKLTLYLGEYLAQNYDLPDQRGDASYDSWQNGYEYYEDMLQEFAVTKCVDIASFMDVELGDGYVTIVSVDGECDLTNENVQLLLSKYGIHDSESAWDIWIDNDGEICTISSEVGDEEYYLSLGRHDLLVTVGDGEGTSNDIVFDNVSYRKVSNGVNVFIYSKNTESIVDSFALYADSGYTIVREYY